MSRPATGKKTPRMNKRRAEEDAGAEADAVMPAEKKMSAEDVFRTHLKEDFAARAPGAFDTQDAMMEALNVLATKINSRVLEILADAQYRINDAVRRGEFSCSVRVDNFPELPEFLIRFDLHAYLTDCLRIHLGNKIDISFIRQAGHVWIEFEPRDE